MSRSQPAALTRRVAQPRPDRASIVVAACAVVGLVGVVVGWADPPPVVPGSQWVALVRVGLACVSTATVLFAPGLVLRRLLPTARDVPLGFVPLPGGAVLVLVGLIVWATARHVDPHGTSRLLLSLVLVAILVGATRVREPLVDAGELRTMFVAAAVFAIGLGKSLWSLGPKGELYAGTISRTLEVGDRSDARVPYHVTTLVAHGLGPYSSTAHSLFAPWTFGDRGPLAGIAATPMMLLSGATPASGLPSQPWTTFDAQGFMAYRIVMMLLAVTALLAVYTLTRRVAGESVAALAVVVCAGTPFFVHDVYFTWPKWAAAAFCLLAAYCLLVGRPIAAGVMIGIGYLLHPLALLSVPTLALLAVAIAVRNRPAADRVRPALITLLRVGLPVAAIFVAWRLVNGSHPSQRTFFEYPFEANSVKHVSLATWVHTRWDILLNTFVPLRLPLADPHNVAINGVFHPSDGLVHFFFQYWTSLTFGAGIVFYPFLLIGLLVMLRRRPWLVTITCVVPLAAFSIYWGSYTSGLLREGLHVWVLTVLIVWALQFERRFRSGRALPPLLRAVLCLRLVEVLLMLSVPTIAYHHRLISANHRPTDVAAVVLMACGLAAVAVLTARVTARRT